MSPSEIRARIVSAEQFQQESPVEETIFPIKEKAYFEQETPVQEIMFPIKEEPGTSVQIKQEYLDDYEISLDNLLAICKKTTAELKN